LFAYGAALASAVVFGGADFLGGLAARRSPVLPVVVGSQLAGLAVLLAALPLLGRAEPTAADLWWGAAAGITGGGGVALLYRALATAAMSIVAPVTAVCALAVPVVVGMLLGERPEPAALAGIALAVVAIGLVSQEGAGAHEAEQGGREPSGGADAAPAGPSRSAAAAAGSAEARRAQNRRGLRMALASGVVIGFFFVFLGRTGEAAGLWPLVPARLVSVALFVGVAAVTRQSLRPAAGTWRIVLAGGALDMVANVLYLLAVREGMLSVVATLSSLYPASTVLLARIVLGERLARVQWAGVACAAAAIVLIVG
jgi:drug/metabolite transporter (DMT)-like permease